MHIPSRCKPERTKGGGIQSALPVALVSNHRYVNMRRHGRRMCALVRKDAGGYGMIRHGMVWQRRKQQRQRRQHGPDPLPAEAANLSLSGFLLLYAEVRQSTGVGAVNYLHFYPCVRLGRSERRFPLSARHPSEHCCVAPANSNRTHASWSEFLNHCRPSCYHLRPCSESAARKAVEAKAKEGAQVLEEKEAAVARVDQLTRQAAAQADSYGVLVRCAAGNDCN